MARYDPVRCALAAVAALLAGLGALAAQLDTQVMALGVPVAIILGFETLVDGSFALVPSGPRWSPARRMLSTVTAIVWVGLAALALGLAAAATGCACYEPGHVPVYLLGIQPWPWVTLGAVAGPVLLAVASVDLSGRRTPGSGR
jgi:hypothetical protein